MHFLSFAVSYFSCQMGTERETQVIKFPMQTGKLTLKLLCKSSSLLLLFRKACLLPSDVKTMLD